MWSKSIHEGDHLAVITDGDEMIIKKLELLEWDEIFEKGEKSAEGKSITKKDFIKAVREELSSNVEHLVKSEVDFNEIVPKVRAFSQEIVDDLSSADLDIVIEKFESTGDLDLRKFRFKKELHPKLSKHPQLRWLKEG